VFNDVTQGADAELPSNFFSFGVGAYHLKIWSAIFKNDTGVLKNIRI